MNFLFTTVLVLLCVAPGLFFYKAYHSGKFSLRYTKLNITDQIFQSIIPSFAIHGILIFILSFLPNCKVQLDVIGLLLLGAKEDKTFSNAFLEIEDSFFKIISYHFCLGTLSYLCGLLLRVLVRRKRWDRKYFYFRYDNYWHYLLTGEVLEIPYKNGFKGLEKASDIQFTVVDVLVATKENNLLYTGILIDYELAKDGGLDCLYLSGTMRKQLKTSSIDTSESNSPQDPAEMENPYYPVEGKIFVIPFKEILNLNLSYYQEEPVETTSTDPEVPIVEFDVQE